LVGLGQSNRARILIHCFIISSPTHSSLGLNQTNTIRAPDRLITQPPTPTHHPTPSHTDAGELPFSAAHNTSDTFWQYLQKDPCRRASFDAMLAQLTAHAAPVLAEAIDEAVAAANAHLAAHARSSLSHRHGQVKQDAAPSLLSAPWPPMLVRPGKYVCDVGGGGGGVAGPSPLLAAVLARHPGTKGEGDEGREGKERGRK
jgi:hypothetical protein